IVPAVVVGVDKQKAQLRVGKYLADLTKDGIAWTKRTSPGELFTAGDVVQVSIVKIDEEAGTIGVTLEQSPIVQGAVIVVENRTGQIKAMVGGSDFSRSKFNRAIQAM